MNYKQEKTYKELPTGYRKAPQGSKIQKGDIRKWNVYGDIFYKEVGSSIGHPISVADDIYRKTLQLVDLTGTPEKTFHRELWCDEVLN